MFKKGQVANPYGSNNKAGRMMVNKIRSSLNMAVDGLGDATTDGATAMSKLLVVALKDDVVGTLKALSSYMPKDIAVDVTHTNSAQSLSDDELADIIAKRVRDKRDAEIDITPKLDINQKVSG